MTATNAAQKACAAIEYTCAALAAWFILAFVYVAFSSMPYPFNLEWMEGQSIDVIQRIEEGKPFYTKPSIEYVPYIYTPLYFYVSALIAKLTGVGFYPARLVSTLSALGAGWVVYAWIRKENHDWKSGLIGAGLFFATYRLSGRWFDNARVDSLALFLTFFSAYTYTHYHTSRSAITAGILATIAFFTKQSALIILLPVFVCGLYTDRRKSILTLTIFAATLIPAIALYEYASNGWFIFYTYRVPAGHEMVHAMIHQFWHGDLFDALTILCLAAPAFIILTSLKNPKQALKYASLSTGAITAAYVARLHGYGYINVLMPAHFLLALLGGLALGYAKTRNDPFLTTGLTLALILQLAILLYNPNPLIPNFASIETGNKFLEKLSEIDGDILMPELQFVQTRVGKKSFTLGMAAFDLIRADLKTRDYIKKDFEKELTQSLESGRFAAVMPGRMVPTPHLRSYYSSFETLQYPKEYVTGAINFLRTEVFVRIPTINQTENPYDR